MSAATAIAGLKATTTVETALNNDVGNAIEDDPLTVEGQQ